MLEYKGLTIYTHPEVYEPAEDTFLFAENLDINRSDEVLEIGTGTGIIAVYAAQRTRKVTATDINEHAVKCALKNTITNRTYNVELKEGNLFEPVEGEKFDLILFNTPYLPTSEEEQLDTELNAAFDGGLEGRETIDAFLNQVKDYLKEGGRVQLVQSSLSDNEKTLAKMKELGFNAEITASEKCFFEEIVVITGKSNTQDD
ncbi:MAG: HemK2/MTQ2 family protein methyltransferase [Methanobacterium sp.]